MFSNRDQQFLAHITMHMLAMDFPLISTLQTSGMNANKENLNTILCYKTYIQILCNVWTEHLKHEHICNLFHIISIVGCLSWCSCQWKEPQHQETPRSSWAVTDLTSWVKAPVAPPPQNLIPKKKVWLKPKNFFFSLVLGSILIFRVPQWGD